MLLNLLDNGIKFTPRGGRVCLDAHSDGGRFIVTVTDSGVGIPSDARDRIFDRFFRVDSVRGRDALQTAGAGLGLSIARWIARAHGGDLRLLRSGAEGSVFEVALPAKMNGT
jgi:two-component system phosphate regulon sensor histidine kinase PhoR